MRAGFGRPGSDLLSRALRHSTIDAEKFHGRVRNGIGWGPLAKTTRPAETGAHGSEPAGDALIRTGYDLYHLFRFAKDISAARAFALRCFESVTGYVSLLYWR